MEPAPPAPREQTLNRSTVVSSSPERFDLGLPDKELPRKEVIQPHLPVQLPCYDFVPVTSPALGAGLPKGLAVRLQALPASMT